jgi:HPt (histidine-containing phosphotransfer) domain-containing protein
MLQGNTQRVISLLCNFRNEFTEAFIDIQAKLGENDMVAAQKLVHTLKGTAGSVGAKSLHQAAEKLDAELKQGRFSPSTVENLRSYFEATMTALETLQKPT